MYNNRNNKTIKVKIKQYNSDVKVDTLPFIIYNYWFIIIVDKR